MKKKFYVILLAVFAASVSFAVLSQKTDSEDQFMKDNVEALAYWVENPGTGGDGYDDGKDSSSWAIKCYYDYWYTSNRDEYVVVCSITSRWHWGACGGQVFGAKKSSDRSAICS